MDILGSIMKKMEKPPALGEKERQLKKMQQELEKKEKEEREKRFAEFRETLTKELNSFAEDETRTRHTFEPMSKPYRSILYAIAEDLELVAHSFGREEVDRHVMIFKECDMPSDAEMHCLRKGEPYVPSSNNANLTTEESQQEVCEQVPHHRTRRNRNAPPPEYLKKYEKQLGTLEFSKESAVKAQAENRSYGCVSSEQKRDKRTIEETLADIRARKKQKHEES